MSNMKHIEWVAFTYSLPAKSGSSTRVTLWRQLRRLGAISPAGSLYLLPASDEAAEAFGWMMEEVRQAGGDALIVRVNRFEGLSDAQISELFNAARAAEYAELNEQAATLEEAFRASAEPQEQEKFVETLARLRRRHTEITRVDYFRSPAGQALGTRLAQIATKLSPGEQATKTISPVPRALYQGRCWVTRPRPYVDRLACAWLIRRFIDPAAVIRFGESPAAGDVTFDQEGAEFGHHGNLCTFETLLLAFDLDDAALRSVAEIVHEIDLRDGRYLRPETAGLDTILTGWQRVGLSDSQMEANGMAVFDALYNALRPQTLPAPSSGGRGT
jgi:hypothetical protein